MDKDGRDWEGGRLALSGWRGCSQREGAMACVVGGYAFQVYFWLPVDHYYHQILVFHLDASEWAYTVYSTTTRVIDISRKSIFYHGRIDKFWVNLGLKDLAGFEVEINWRFAV
jgi:hypothetical protein